MIDLTTWKQYVVETLESAATKGFQQASKDLDTLIDLGNVFAWRAYDTRMYVVGSDPTGITYQGRMTLSGGLEIPLLRAFLRRDRYYAELTFIFSAKVGVPETITVTSSEEMLEAWKTWLADPEVKLAMAALLIG